MSKWRYGIPPKEFIIGFLICVPVIVGSVVFMLNEPETSVEPRKEKTLDGRVQFIVGCSPAGIVECKRQIDTICLGEPGRVELQNEGRMLVSCPSEPNHE